MCHYVFFPNSPPNLSFSFFANRNSIIWQPSGRQKISRIHPSHGPNVGLSVCPGPLSTTTSYLLGISFWKAVNPPEAVNLPERSKYDNLMSINIATDMMADRKIDKHRNDTKNLSICVKYKILHIYQCCSKLVEEVIEKRKNHKQGRHPANCWEKFRIFMNLLKIPWNSSWIRVFRVAFRN